MSENLEEKCLEYDRENGRFPESEYEGFAIYCFLTDKNENLEKHQQDWLEKLKNK